MFKYALLTVGPLVTALGLAQADGDIVYSARYYYPPGTKTDRTRTRSRFHLYRVNPDGKGREQITFGPWDDLEPKWSPNGRSILFFRDKDNDEGGGIHSFLCVVKPGSPMVRLATSNGTSFEHADWSADGKWIVSGSRDYEDNARSKVRLIKSDGKLAYTFRGFYGFSSSPDSAHFLLWNENTVRLVDAHGHNILTIKYSTSSACFLSNKLLCTLAGAANGKPPHLEIRDLSGTLKRQVELLWNVQPEGPSSENPDKGLRDISALPGDNNSVVAKFDVGNSSMRPWNQYVRIRLADGRMDEITDGQFLAWSPDHKRVLTSGVKTLQDYDGRRSLYMTDLLIGPYGKLSDYLDPIVGGRVWVVGADWRAHP